VNAQLNAGDRVLLTDGRSATVADIVVERYPVYGRAQHDVWVLVSLDGAGYITVPVHRIEERLPDD